ncbi:neuronal acetylcholine receptor subunit beta-3 isoform X2 [Exaiptasia diaphana]|uniref:Neurotransmitter-gated ion-channel ligand-binding domain-containing protein n=1 Tax=Exaiptasia diaphana TaxID=2652724 RepID=A0A913YG70_EXADI|nr:neuronal acetylcholine receptor subunit beta-3 isoform X2 [Exaiptasia diaphana]
MDRCTFKLKFVARTVQLLVIFHLVWSLEGVIKANVTRYEDLLFKDLFRGYNKEIRPVLKESDAVEAEFGFALSEIIDLDEKNQVLATNVWIRQRQLRG